MRTRTLVIPAVLAAAAIALAPAAAQASAYHGTFTVPGGTTYARVVIPSVHGQLVRFAVGYTDGYVHVDPIPASSKVQEIDNYTGQAPDVQGWNGCAKNKAGQVISGTHQPDELFPTDSAASESSGLGGGTTKATSLHHNVTITITPISSGPYFLWCHYEHGPETWVNLTFQDGSTVKIYWGTEGTSPTYFRELLIAHGGTATTVSAVAADD